LYCFIIPSTIYMETEGCRQRYWKGKGVHGERTLQRVDENHEIQKFAHLDRPSSVCCMFSQSPTSCVTCSSVNLSPLFSSDRPCLVFPFLVAVGGGAVCVRRRRNANVVVVGRIGQEIGGLLLFVCKA
jgi:hypothetical protein